MKGTKPIIDILAATYNGERVCASALCIAKLLKYGGVEGEFPRSRAAAVVRNWFDAGRIPQGLQ